MRKRILILFTVLLTAGLKISAQGVEFYHITLEEALQKAKSENKNVFIDFYTVWCGPCKKMVKSVFPDAEVGAFYNKEFVSLKLDAEKEGMEVAKKYGVTNYPTLLYLDVNGDVMYKATAFKPIDTFIQIGKDALATLKGGKSLETLQEEFPNKQNDAAFLKMYYNKMIEYGQSPSAGFDQWLKVQTEFKETDMALMKELLKNGRYILVGSYGETLLNRNRDAYISMADKFEKRELQFINKRIVLNTQKEAKRTQNPEIWKQAMNGYENLSDKEKRGFDSLAEQQLVYFSMTKDDKAFKQLTEQYMDSFMAANKPSEIKAEDKESYERRAASLKNSDAMGSEELLDSYKNGIRGGSIVEDVEKKGQGYLERINRKKEYKTLEKWIDYGYEMGSSKFYMDNLLADMYYKQGKAKKAIALKQEALNNWRKLDKRRVVREYELEQMKKGEAY